MRNIPQDEFEKMCLALSGVANAPDPHVEDGKKVGQTWSPSSVEVMLRYAADIKKLEEWLRQRAFVREITVVKVPCKIGRELWWKDVLAEVYDMGAYSQPPVKYSLKKEN